jgi:hypothetical protein
MKNSPNPGLQAQSVGATAAAPSANGVRVRELMPLGHVLHSAMEPPGLYVPLVQGVQKAPPKPGWCGISRQAARQPDRQADGQKEP